MPYIFDQIEDDTENYKRKIRGADYDELVRGITNESITFIFNENGENNTVVVNFVVDFSFSFEDGFSNVRFSDFEFIYDNFESPENMIEELTKYIKEEFVNVDRLSE
jgi:hypothetical protein